MGLFRLCLAISVLCFHLGQVHAHTNSIFGCTFLNGETALQSFFMISGFYMALVLHEKYVGPGSYRIFITQRILRLCPTYWATLLLTAAIIGLLILAGDQGQLHARSLYFWRDHLHEAGFFSMIWIIVSNIGALGLSELWFFGFDPTTGNFSPWIPPAAPSPLMGDGFFINPPAWSVSLEVYFYFMAPKLVRSPIWFQAALVVASISLRYFIQYSLHWPYIPFVYYNFFCQLGFFVAGSICYRFYVTFKQQIEQWTPSLRPVYWVLALMMLFYRRLPWTHQLYFVAIPLIFLLIPLLFALTRHNATDRLLGELSYPFYLSHYVVLIMANHFHNYLSMVWVGPACLAITLIMAWLLYRHVESVTERIRARLYHRQCPKATLSAEYFPQEAIERQR
jgi:peptidoglycan/LPS O-acetylase OafA/YrhL